MGSRGACGASDPRLEPQCRPWAGTFLRFIILLSPAAPNPCDPPVANPRPVEWQNLHRLPLEVLHFTVTRLTALLLLLLNKADGRSSGSTSDGPIADRIQDHSNPPPQAPRRPPYRTPFQSNDVRNFATVRPHICSSVGHNLLQSHDVCSLLFHWEWGG